MLVDEQPFGGIHFMHPTGPARSGRFRAITPDLDAQVAPTPCPTAPIRAIDPEEAFVASLASCHMLWFLSLAAKKRFRRVKGHREMPALAAALRAKASEKINEGTAA